MLHKHSSSGEAPSTTMNRDAVISGLMATVRPTGCSIQRTGSRLIVKNREGYELGVVLFGPSESPRCVAWIGDYLAAECAFSSETGWRIYRIDQGKRSPTPIEGVDPVQYIIRESAVPQRPAFAAV